MTHPLFGTDAWRDMVLAGRLPCTKHPKGCSGLVTLAAEWPFSDVRDVPCVAPSWCWCGEPCTEPRGTHEACWRARYAVAFAVERLALAFAPLNETRLARAFRVIDDSSGFPGRFPRAADTPLYAASRLLPVGGGPERLSKKKAGA